MPWALGTTQVKSGHRCKSQRKTRKAKQTREKSLYGLAVHVFLLDENHPACFRAVKSVQT